MRGKRTEIDSLNGFIARRGAELAFRLPSITRFFALVKLAEESNEMAAQKSGAAATKVIPLCAPVRSQR